MALLWQGIVFTNQTFEDELDFDISDIEQILENNGEETK